MSSFRVPIFVWVLINVVLIKMGAYIHGVLIFYGCLLFRFYSRFCASRKRETGRGGGCHLPGDSTWWLL